MSNRHSGLVESRMRGNVHVRFGGAGRGDGLPRGSTAPRPDPYTLLHEGGWSVRGEPGPHVTWIRPDGRPHEPRVRVTLDTC